MTKATAVAMGPWSMSVRSMRSPASIRACADEAASLSTRRASARAWAKSSEAKKARAFSNSGACIPSPTRLASGMYSRFAGCVKSSGVTGASLAVPGVVARLAVVDWVFWAMWGRKLPEQPRAGKARQSRLVSGPLMLSRRQLLALPLLCAASRAGAFGEQARLQFAQVRHGGRWDPRPDGLARLAWEISKRTSIETTPIVKPMGLADPDLFRYPFAVLSSDGGFPAPADNEVAELRRYLSYGGFLLIDDASGQRGGPFEQSARRLVSRVVAGAQLARIPREHVLYKSFYLLDGPAGRVAVTPDLEGLELGGRIGILYSGNDLIGALARDSLGSWEFEVTPGGELQREKSIRLGVNLAMYALCLDYKEDQVHIPFIMKRRRI